MADYVDNSTQTIIAGLVKDPSPIPAVLIHDSTTPPPDMPSKGYEMPKQPMSSTISPTQLVRKKKRPPLVARISLPASELDVNTPGSPPPTEALMSPLPAANTLHAGHTPIFPRSLSPLQREDRSNNSTPPEEEEVLSGPLTLPALPGDGTEDHIELKVLDAELEKIAKEQGIVDQDDIVGSDVSPTVEHGGQGGRKGSKDVRRASSTEEVIEVVDGVILKKPRMNLGAPLGQV